MMKEHATQIVQRYEEGAITDMEAAAKLQELTGREVHLDWLREYWRSESMEEFVDRLCAEPIRDWAQITDVSALDLIAEFIATESPGRPQP